MISLPLFRTLNGNTVEFDLVDDLARKFRRLEMQLEEQRHQNEEQLQQLRRENEEQRRENEEQRRENEEQLQQLRHQNEELMNEIREIKWTQLPPPGELSRIPSQ